MTDGYNRFEKARIIGARALQISLGAPTLVKVPPELIDPIKIAQLEYENGVIPITVKREDIDFSGTKKKRRRR